jgi:NADH-quinone oxidoreductase subunit N
MDAAVELLNKGVGLIVPELILLATVCVMFVVGPFLVTESGQGKPGLRGRWTVLALIALGAAAMVWCRSEVTPAGDGPFRVDGLAWLVRGLSLTLGAALVLLLSNQIDDGHAAEANACLLAILAGVNMTALANDLVTLFLALELVSIPTYVLLYLPRRDQEMQEATIKYVLLSIFSSAMVLYGMSLVYGAAGTTNLTRIAAELDSGERLTHRGLLLAATALLTAGLSFRLAAVPFHFYAPDVFQGVTSSAAAMLSFVPKLVGVATLLRLLPIVGALATAEAASPETPARLLLGILAVATMFLGNLLALRQKHLHRLLAYSSIAHAGYMLVGLAAGVHGAPVAGVEAVLFYLAAYGVMTVGFFCLVGGASSPKSPITMNSDLAGLSRIHPAISLFMAISLFSLAGLPPTAGFSGKLNLFFASWSEGSRLGRVLAVCLAVNAAISAYYYLRLIATIYLDPPSAERKRSARLAPAAAGAVLAVATIVLFAAPQPLWDAAARCLP